MSLPEKCVAAFLLLSLTVVINAAGLTLVLRGLRLGKVESDPGFWPPTWLLIRLAAWVVVIHIAAISVWALFYWWKQCVPDFESALYFSVITYTTVGYGDIVLPPDWRLFSGVEALTGILMCGLSTGIFFAVVSRLHALHPHLEKPNRQTRALSRPHGCPGGGGDR